MLHYQHSIPSTHQNDVNKGPQMNWQKCKAAVPKNLDDYSKTAHKYCVCIHPTNAPTSKGAARKTGILSGIR